MRNSMQRFYIKDLKITENSFILRDVNIVYQLVKVLRTRIGMEIILFDGIENLDYLCKILDFWKKEIELELLEEIQKDCELSFGLNLYQAFPNKLDKIEYIIQKWVEVWFSSFTFYRSERSQKISITEKKEERLYKILVEAVEQSWRNKIPKLEISVGNQSIGSLQWESIFFHTNSENSLLLKDYTKWNNNKKIEKLNILIWPEWWFSDAEVKIFEEQQLIKINLWNRILRTETAWVAVWFTLGQML